MLRSHLRMNGRWTLVPARRRRCRGRPWLVLRGSRVEARQWNGPVLELHARGRSGGSGRTSSPTPPDLDAMLAQPPPRATRAARSATRSSTSASSPGSGTSGRPRRSGQARLSPWRRARRDDRRGARAPSLEAAAALMRARSTGARAATTRLPPRRPAVPALRRDGSARAGQGDANRIAYWCPGCQAERSRPRRTGSRGGSRSAPSRRRCARSASRRSPSSRPRRSGASPIRRSMSHDAHGPGLYEYRPLVRDHVEARAFRLAKLPDAADRARRAAPRAGGGDLRARARGRRVRRPRALPGDPAAGARRRTAEACGGFDWDDGAFERVYAELERSLFGASRSYARRRAARRPLDRRAGRARAGARRAPVVAERARGALAGGDGPAAAALRRRARRSCVLELERELPAEDDEPPDAPAELADAVTALRLATGGAGRRRAGRASSGSTGTRSESARCCRSPRPSRPGEPSRLDPLRGSLAGDLLERLAGAGGRPRARPRRSTAGSSRSSRTSRSRSEQLRESLAALLGGADGALGGGDAGDAAARRTAPRARRAVDRLRRLRAARPAASRSRDDVRRALVEVLQHDDRARLLDRARRGAARPATAPGRLLRRARARELTISCPTRHRHVESGGLPSRDGGSAARPRAARAHRGAPARSTRLPARPARRGCVRCCRRRRPGRGPSRACPEKALQSVALGREMLGISSRTLLA